MLEVYAAQPIDRQVRTVEQAMKMSCNWEGPASPSVFNGVPRGVDFGALPDTSDRDPAGFYAAPFAGWASDTFRFDLYRMQTPNEVDEFALRLRMWISVRGDDEVHLGGDNVVPMATMRSLHLFANITVKNGLWWNPEP